MNNDYQKREAKRIREQYVEKEETKLEQLRRLDRKVKLPAEIFVYSFGIIGSLVLGLGMCLAMKVMGDLMALGIVIGCIGIIMIGINYPSYKKMLNSRKKKYGKQIIDLSDSLINS